MSDRTCSMVGCDKPLRSTGARWCNMHYFRWYRHGDPEITEWTHTKSLVPPHIAARSMKYRTTQRPDHLLAPPCGRMYVHRVVLFDAIGYGPHKCHWCGEFINWDAGLEVDHLDGNGFNNELTNLVPSCKRCNSGRAQHARHLAHSATLWHGPGAEAVRRTLPTPGHTLPDSIRAA